MLVDFSPLADQSFNFLLSGFQFGEGFFPESLQGVDGLWLQ